MNIRPAIREDSTQLLELMKGLAEFEGCLDDFCVTLDELEERGFSCERTPEFYALVAEQDAQLHGMLVYYFIPFTLDLRPTLFIKELFVMPGARGAGVGEQLFAALRETALEQGCGRIKWDVLHDNEAAKRFYERQGARQDSQWLGFILNI